MKIVQVSKYLKNEYKPQIQHKEFKIKVLGLCYPDQEK